jgi:hypothetical protein
VDVSAILIDLKTGEEDGNEEQVSKGVPKAAAAKKARVSSPVPHKSAPPASSSPPAQASDPSLLAEQRGTLELRAFEEFRVRRKKFHDFFF